MKYYSQKDIKWAYHKLGTCNTTIKNNGCFITCLAMLDGRTPAEVNSLLTKKGGYARGCLVVQSKCSTLLGLEDKGKTYKEPNYICIAETNHYKRQGVPQHFYIWNPNGTIVDPLDKNPTWKKNPYNIVSYRLIKLKKPMKNEETPNENEIKLLKFIKNKIKDWGNRLNSSERKKIEKEITTFKKDNEILQRDNEILRQQIKDLQEENFILKQGKTARELAIKKETKSSSLIEKIKSLLNIK